MSQIQDAGFAIAYTLIPVLLLFLRVKRAEVLCRPRIVVGFALFIFLCGLTHLGHILVFYWPAYRLFVSIGMLGAVVSLFVAACTPEVVRHVMSLRSPVEYQQVITEKDRQAATNDRVRAALQKENESLRQREKRTGYDQWCEDTHKVLDKLSAALESVR